MSGSKRFPIMSGPSIPWEMIAPYEGQALANHGQSLEDLARRGGLDPAEALAVLSCLKWRDSPWSNPVVRNSPAPLEELERRRAEFEGPRERISQLEAALRDKDLALAETGALVLNHEGHISRLDAELEKLTERFDDSEAENGNLGEECGRLEEECSKLSAGVCEHLLGDAHGNPTCAAREQVRKMENGGCDGCPSFRIEQTLQQDRSRLHAKLVLERAKTAVMGGEWCAENRAAGRDRCGACAWCVNFERERAEKAEALAKQAHGIVYERLVEIGQLVAHLDVVGEPNTAFDLVAKCVAELEEGKLRNEEAQDEIRRLSGWQEQALEQEKLLTAAKEEIVLLRSEGVPGVMHAADEAFYELTVKERNTAWEKLNHLEKDLAAERDGVKTLRIRYGAMESETFPAFVERLYNEVRWAHRDLDTARYELRTVEEDSRKSRHAERWASAAMVYLAGKISTPEKISPEWIQEALKHAETLLTGLDGEACEQWRAAQAAFLAAASKEAVQAFADKVQKFCIERHGFGAVYEFVGDLMSPTKPS